MIIKLGLELHASLGGWSKVRSLNTETAHVPAAGARAYG